MVVECIRFLEYVVLQDSIKDIWVWRLHSSKRYNVRSAYHFLTNTEDAQLVGGSQAWWSKAVPLKVNIGVILFQLRLRFILMRVFKMRIGILFFSNVIILVNFGQCFLGAQGSCQFLRISVGNIMINLWIWEGFKGLSYCYSYHLDSFCVGYLESEKPKEFSEYEVAGVVYM